MSTTSLYGFLVLALLITGSLGEDAPACRDILPRLLPCMDFIGGGSGPPTVACCSGVQRIAAQIKDRRDRTAVCNCIQQALSGAGTYDPSRLPRLGKDCQVSIRIPPIDSHTDCSKA